MPIIHSKSPEAFQQNIKTEIASGKEPKQAVAIAYNVAGKEKRTGEKISKSIHKDQHHSSHIEELGSAYEQSVSTGAKNNHPVVTMSRMKSEE
jgi:hypothetical protein